MLSISCFLLPIFLNEMALDQSIVIIDKMGDL